MTIHIDPNADIIQQLKDLSEIITTRNVTVMVADSQYRQVEAKITGWIYRKLPNFIIKSGTEELEINIIQGNFIYHLTEEKTYDGLNRNSKSVWD